MKQPIVAIIGKPNVGKSTLFNRLIGRRIAITSDVAGTTRDRLTAHVTWQGLAFNLVDTAGLELATEQKELPRNIAEQAALAIEEADLILFLVNGQSELTREDLQVVEKLRRSNKPVILVVNKAESAGTRERLSDFYKLGLGEPLAISAIHGTGVAELLDEIAKRIRKEGLEAAAKQELSDIPKIALVGRPNVGKSTLLNHLAGTQRAVVSDIPGTTRDTVDTLVKANDQEFIFLDTAGIRRRGRIERGIEKFSVLRTLNTIQQSDLTVVLLDATEGPVRGDVHVVTYALESGKPVIIAINKIDMVTPEQVQIGRFSFMTKLPTVFISAKTGKGVSILLKEISNQINLMKNK